MKDFFESLTIKEKAIFKKWLDNLLDRSLSNKSFKNKILKDNSLALSSLDSNIAKKLSLTIKEVKDNRVKINLSQNSLKIALPKSDKLSNLNLDAVSGGLTTVIQMKKGSDGKLYYAEDAVQTDGNLDVDLNEKTGAFRFRTSV